MNSLSLVLASFLSLPNVPATSADMINIHALHGLLARTLSPSDIHTAILFTSAGDLLSFASDPPRTKDEIRIIVGLCTEVWQETRVDGYGMVDSEYGKLIVFPVSEYRKDDEKSSADSSRPALLLVLNASDAFSWEELQQKGKSLSIHLANHFDSFHHHIAVFHSRPSSTAASPAPIRV